MEALPIAWAQPGAHRFPAGDILLMGGSRPGSKQYPVLRLGAGDSTWTTLPDRWIGAHDGLGERLWVKTREGDDLAFGWLSSDGRFHPSPNPMDLQHDLYGFVAHPSGVVTAWSGPAESGLTVRQGDGAKWRPLSAAPARWLFGGWGNADGELVLIGPSDEMTTEPLAQVAIAWRGGAWGPPTSLPVHPSDPAIVVGARRVQPFDHMARHGGGAGDLPAYSTA